MKAYAKKKTPFAKFELISNGVFNSDFPKGYNLATGMCDTIKINTNVFLQDIREVKTR